MAYRSDSGVVAARWLGKMLGILRRTPGVEVRAKLLHRGLFVEIKFPDSATYWTIDGAPEVVAATLYEQAPLRGVRLPRSVGRPRKPVPSVTGAR